MNGRRLIESVMDLPSRKDVKHGVVYKGPKKPSLRKRLRYWFVYKMALVYWKLKHLLRCEGKYMTEPGLVRYCRKCQRFTIKDSRLREAFKKGGIEGLVNKKKEILESRK